MGLAPGSIPVMPIIPSPLAAMWGSMEKAALLPDWQLPPATTAPLQQQEHTHTQHTHHARSAHKVHYITGERGILSCTR